MRTKGAKGQWQPKVYANGMTLAEMSAASGLSSRTLYERISRGVPPEMWLAPMSAGYVAGWVKRKAVQP